MFKSKTIFSLLVLLSMLISCGKSFANLPIPPHPICAINATVLDVQKTREEIVFDKPHSYVDYYAVRLKIHNSAVFRNEKYGSCDNLINTEKDSILLLSEYDKSPIKTGQEINANIEFKGGVRFSGYFLSDIKILDK